VTGMQMIRVGVFGADGVRAERVVRAGLTPVPGLVVNEDPVKTGTWNITHAVSGAAIAVMIPDPEAALHVAGCLGGVCDWTMTAQQLAAIGGIANSVVRALDEIDALEFLPRGRGVVREALL
jgi:hypothetical protein